MRYAQVHWSTEQIAGRMQRSGEVSVSCRDLSERSAIVADNQRAGHWEDDTIIGKAHQRAVDTLVDRCHRFTLTRALTDRTAAQIGGAIQDLLAPFTHSRTPSLSTTARSSPATGTSPPTSPPVSYSPAPTTPGNVASTNTPTAYSASSSPSLRTSAPSTMSYRRMPPPASTIAPQGIWLVPPHEVLSACCLTVGSRLPTPYPLPKPSIRFVDTPAHSALHSPLANLSHPCFVALRCVIGAVW